MHKEAHFSRVGYILAMAGSAIGLGTAWKFPTMVGLGGGFAFILVYLVLCLAIGAAAFLAEALLGRATGRDTVGAIYELAPNAKRAWSIGGFFVFVSIMIVPFYLVVVGWIFYYAMLCMSQLPTDPVSAKEAFGYLASNNIFGVSMGFLIVFALSIYTILKGVKKGIEKLNLVLMPSLFILLIALVTYSAIFGNFTGAASFLFTPDLSKVLDADLLLKALGLAMFSMSLGMGTVCTYAANTDKFTNLFSSVFYIIVLNTMVGILMGLVVFSFIPIENASEGPGLIFVSLASLFGSMGVAGQIIGFAFFMALIFAGITSAISIIEPTALFLMNNIKVERPKAVAYCAVFIFVVGFVCILSYYKPSAEVFTFFGKSFFDLLDYITSIILMPLGALFFCVFVGWVVPKSTLAENLKHQMPKGVFEIWVWVIRIIVPAAIISVGVYNFL